LPAGLSIDAASGVIAGTIDHSASLGSPYTVTVTADDGNGATIADTFTLSVTNPPPVTTTTPTPPAYSDANGNNQYDPGEGNGTITGGTISGGRTGGQTVVTRNFDVPQARIRRTHGSS
jgi:hypothetical protein